MDTEKCRALFKILQCGSFSAAAEQMGYTPSGLSRMIASMEEDTGFPLLQRSREGVKATKECEKILPVFKEFIAADEKYRQIVHEINGVETGTIVVAFQFCYTAEAEATSFLRNSCGHPQVQTVPSSAWDAPCPVVTPSLKGLGSAFSVFTLWKY